MQASTMNINYCIGCIHYISDMFVFLVNFQTFCHPIIYTYDVKLFMKRNSLAYEQT